MLKLFYPSYYAESVFTIDYEKLKALGFKAIIFDIDNTLVPHGEPSTDEVDELMKAIKSIGFKIFFLSDNGVKRIDEFNKNIGAPYIDNANKPQRKNYLKAVNLLGLDKSEVIVIGDQVFTDILGANLSSIRSILVKYIGFYEKGAKGKRRDTEALILRKYENSRYYNILGDIER